jgi:DUF4097 and DUF4098 domain-containing protein YvlB
MESKNRGVWILVVLAGIALCCCVALLAAVALSQVWGWNWGWGLDVPAIWQEGGEGVEGARIERTFDVGSAPTLMVDNVAGSLTVRSGDGNEIRIVAVKHAALRRDLERIEVKITPQEGALHIETTKPRSLSSAWVDLTITAPADTRLDLSTGSGTVEVRGFDGGAQLRTGSGSVVAQSLRGDLSLHTGSGSMTIQEVAGRLKADTGSGGIDVQGMDGELEAHTGSGSIDVRRAAGPARLITGSGRVSYQGSPQGDCRFTTGSGGISLRMPASLDAQIDLHTGSGSVRVGYPVDGLVTRSDVQGTIGRDGPTAIFAETGSGNIDLVSE